MPYDRQRLQIAVQSLEDHAHTLLEAHAEAPPAYCALVRSAIDELQLLDRMLSEDDNDDGNT